MYTGGSDRMAQLNIGLRHPSSLGNISAVVTGLLIAAVAVLGWWLVMEAIAAVAEAVAAGMEGAMEWVLVEFG